MKENELPFLGLNIIVKNEEKVIARMLETVAPLIDWYTIVDTGSTDRTKEICKEVMDKHGIPGEIIDHKWENFCAARNAALQAAKGKCEFAFWIDADEQLIWPDKFSKDKLITGLKNFDAGAITVNYGSQTYFRTQFMRVSCPWEWRGAVHEIQLPKEGSDFNPRGTQVGGLSVLVTPDGASWGDGSDPKAAQEAKYREHAEMLHEYIKTDSDIRWIFYLAQSYRDSFQWELAEKYYQQRTDSEEGYWEERYFSALMVASMRSNQGKPVNEIMEAYAYCSRFDYRRAEHFIPIIRYYQGLQNWPMAYSLSKYVIDNCSKNPFPTSSLFIDKATYDWQCLDLHCISAFYMGKLPEAKKIYNKLRKAINAGLVPESEHKRIIDNDKWYKQAAKDKSSAPSPNVIPILKK